MVNSVKSVGNSPKRRIWKEKVSKKTEDFLSLTNDKLTLSIIQTGTKKIFFDANLKFV